MQRIINLDESISHIFTYTTYNIIYNIAYIAVQLIQFIIRCIMNTRSVIKSESGINDETLVFVYT